MILAWKAVYGYFPIGIESGAYRFLPGSQHIFSNVKGVNSSFFVKTDSGAFALPIVPDTVRGTNISGSVIAIGGELEAIIGRNEFAALYTLPGLGPSYYTNMSQQTPSMFLNCPNLITHQSSHLDNPAIYIPGLNRYIVCGGFTSTGGYGHIVDGTSGDVIGGWASLQSQNYAYFICNVKYNGNPDSLLDGNGYVVIRQTQPSGSGTYFCDRSVIDYSGCPALFTSYSPPDAGYPDNPYEPGGESCEGGGGGTFDDESDSITKPPIPTLSSANTGFTRIYNPTLSQVQDLARYLWTDESVIQTIWNHIKQFFENPMDAIIGFNLVPVPVPDAGSKNFALMFIDTGVSMNVAASQFVDVDCGTLTISPYYGSALDYSPYTQISCFLPYIGNVSLDVDEVMGRTLQVSYRVDICSGSCVAYIEVDGNAIYQYSGHCAIPIPLASADFSSYVNAAISTAKLAGASLLAGAGVGAAVHVENTTQETNQVVTKKTQTAQGAPRTSSIETKTQQDESSTEASFAAISPQNITNTVGQVMSSKPHIEHSGSFSGNSGYLGVRRPFVIIKRPNMCLPANYQSLNGFPSMITLKLGDCTGFTRVQQVQLTGLTATNPEQAEILSLLKTGVVF